MKTLILTYDPSRFASTPRVVEAFLANHKDVTAWSSPFSGCYFLKTDNSAKDISRTLDLLFDNRQFVVAEITAGSEEINGRAVAEIWDFINDRSSDQ